ncbi:MAG: tetratricopeptide repeat protein, partial [Burkholderiales bacterium]|nr:tetratricopeptide repeat protein [Burkholderiales bacterium]
LRDGRLGAAEAALRAALDLDPANAGALSNLVQTLQREGRVDAARAYARRLAAVQPLQPYASFEAGRQAMAQGDFARARDLFERELRLQPDQSEVHYWLAQALWRLGDRRDAVRHLALAADNSTTPGSRDLYTAKLEHLKALHLQ